MILLLPMSSLPSASNMAFRYNDGSAFRQTDKSGLRSSLILAVNDQGPDKLLAVRVLDSSLPQWRIYYKEDDHGITDGFIIR
jgi:hypothetical protein